MPFLIAALIIPYYIPYIFHRSINRDLINLKDAIKEGEPDVDRIVEYFFNVFRHPSLWSCWTVIANIIIKIFYIGVNVGTFLAIDYLVNNQFRYYGHRWVQWAQLQNTAQFDYMGSRTSPKPGNFLLPAFGYCQVHNSAKDIKESKRNEHKFVCEISQHVLYQYVLLILWMAIVCGIVISFLGLLVMILHYFYSICIRCVLFVKDYTKLFTLN